MVSFLDPSLAGVILNDISTASAYGFPTQANFDQLQESNFESLSPPHIHKDLLDQLRIAQLYKTLGKTLYENVSDPSRVPLIDERSATYNHARTLYEDVANSLGPDVSSKWYLF